MHVRMIDFPQLRLHVSSLTDYKRRKAATKEPETVEWLRDCGRRFGGYCLLDVGANVGGYSLIACALDARHRAVAVEPFPPTFLTLCRNVAENGLQDRIVPLNALIGTGDARGTVGLTFNAWHSGVAEHPADGRMRLNLPSVDAQGLQRHLHDAAAIVCKIDVDGAEVPVVEALQPLLRDRRSRSVLIECDERTRADVERLLGEAGFTPVSSYMRNNHRQVNLICERSGHA